ncbi:NADPH-dependent F420 reductase [Acidisoma silvae]|uniref:NAD(P)-binding domain-containing protein n=1 Tax=Acidisoma silvae TaxID=2802396 RepID=A0A963YWX0_9PROT|nr:NAD(P)-binding domain-containing protein [Acidisoma silvae]MCB8877805.1 NAD(P)-binding domain-containing protein [Acidisoma silvae]
MKIGIIGSGQIGGTLTRQFRLAKHDVSVANTRGPASLAALLEETGAFGISLNDVVKGQDIAVIAVPTKSIPDLPSNLFAHASQNLVVIDASNYYPQQRDGYIGGIEGGLTESAWVEQQIGRPVVKAFNTIIARHLLERGKPASVPGRIALAIAGDNPAAKRTVAHLIDQIGFDAVDAGPIAESWRQQPGSPGYLKDGDAYNVQSNLSQAENLRAPEWRATPNSPGTYNAPA